MWKEKRQGYQPVSRASPMFGLPTRSMFGELKECLDLNEMLWDGDAQAAGTATTALLVICRRIGLHASESRRLGAV